MLAGKRVVVVDDSIVWGTTTPRIVSLLRRAGVREVHFRITTPPISSPCYFGVDMATRSELIAANQTVSEINAHIGSDSLGFLSLEGLMKAIGRGQDKLCNACFTGRYPIDVQMQMERIEAARKEPALAAAESLNRMGRA